MSKTTEDNPDLSWPKISEDRSTGRGVKEIVQSVKKKTFAEEIANDKEKAAVYINRPAVAANVLGSSDPIARQEAAAAEVYKRALLLVGAGGLQINGVDNQTTKSAATNNLPTPTYLAHGGRVMIELPAGIDGDKLINWLTSGDKEKDGRSTSQSQDGAIAENKIVYNRSAATHGVVIKEQKNEQGAKQYVLEEVQGFMIGAKDFLKNKVLGKQTKHYGVDLAMNAEFGGKDSEGKVVNKPDGDHGHLYINYTPSRDGKPAVILIGVEGAAPTSSKHSKTGAPDPRSAVDGSKFGDLRDKKDQVKEGEYKDTLIPKNYGGMLLKLDINKLNAITAMQSKEFGVELAYTKPGAGPAEFLENLHKVKTEMGRDAAKSTEKQVNQNEGKAPAKKSSLAVVAGGHRLPPLPKLPPKAVEKLEAIKQRHIEEEAKQRKAASSKRKVTIGAKRDSVAR